MTKKMTPKEEYDFYANPDNQMSRGEPRRRRRRSEPRDPATTRTRSAEPHDAKPDAESAGE